MAKTRVKDKRRVSDYWTQKARADKYPARSVYKLEEVDEKHRLFKPGQKVVDLGCAPGSWTMYAAGRVGDRGLVIGLDLNKPSGNFSDNIRIIQADVMETPAADFKADGPFDIVMSDMAPKTTGVKNVDQARSMELCLAALTWARTLLKPGGVLLFKIFQGPDADGLIKDLNIEFKSVRRIKPKSSRSFSTEIFVLASGYKKDTP